jgi:glyoxylase-like metal-dependent hydrolase (beta-lactamase superfamily II)
VQEHFSTRYDVPYNEWGAVFDETLQDDQEFAIGNLRVTAMHTPGHTPDHMGYKIGGRSFSSSLGHQDEYTG